MSSQVFLAYFSYRNTCNSPVSMQLLFCFLKPDHAEHAQSSCLNRGLISYVCADLLNVADFWA